MSLCAVPVIAIVCHMQDKLTILIGFAQSNAVQLLEGNLPFDSVLGLKTDEFADQGFDEA